MESKGDTAIKALREFGFVLIDKTRADKPAIEVDLRGAMDMAKDSIIEHLQHLTGLQNLFLDNTSVTDNCIGSA